ncbi:MAG: acyltransferase [Clostridiales bacterium]|nr:acyltransferase [Clostridiales bacterium]
MNILGFVLIYAALALLLFFGVKISKRKTWNEDVMSFDQTKCFLGFCAAVIVLHHIAQDTCASWLNPWFIRHGLDIFVTAGYRMVGMFFFFSGFGLYKSAKSKPDFFKRFIPVRFIPILIPTLLTFLVYVFFMYWRKVPFEIDPPFQVGSHNTWHPYIWYVPCMLILYLSFYIGFGFFKKDWIGILVVIIGTAGWIAFCWHFHYGTWWFNTPHMFLIGILVSKYEKKFFESCKKLYVLRVIGTIILCIVLHWLADNAGGYYLMKNNYMYFGDYAYKCDLINAIFQVLDTLAFMSLYYLLGMKLKVGNKVSRFFGKMTLELYLIHGIFIHMFGYYMIHEGISPVKYIKSVPLFTLVVFALSIPISYGVSIVDKKVGKLLRPKK